MAGAVTQAEGISGATEALRMEAVVDGYEGMLLRYAGRILNDQTAAQDVVQNVFIKVFRGWPRSMPPANRLRSWLYRVTHNEAVDHIRRESRLRLLHEKEAAEEALSCPDGVHCGTSSEDRRQLVMDCLGRLAEREKQVVLLRMEEGLSYKEIADITGRTVGNVGNILHHAIRNISGQLKRKGIL